MSALDRTTRPSAGAERFLGRLDEPLSRFAPTGFLNVVLVGDVDRRSLAAARVATGLGGDTIALHVATAAADGDATRRRWDEVVGRGMPLVTVCREDGEIDVAVAAFVVEQLEHGQSKVRVLISYLLHRSVWHNALHDATGVSIARLLATVPMTDVLLIPYVIPRQPVP